MSARPVDRETEILPRVARVETGAEDVEPLRAALGADLAWDRLVWLASWHRLTALVNARLQTSAKDLVPEPVRRRLHHEATTITQRALLYAGELRGIVRLLRAHEIPALPYKGPMLAAQLYGNFALRDILDLDLLIARDDVWRAAELLGTLGYEAATTVRAIHRRAYMASECDLGLVHARFGLKLELHWAVVPPCFSLPLSAERLLERAEWQAFLGDRMPTLAPADLLLVLCINGSKEMWRRLERICAVAQVVRQRPGLDWADLCASARDLGARRMLASGLRLAHDLLGAPVSAEALGELRAPKLVASARRQLLVEDARRRDGWSATRFRLLTMDRWRARARYCLLRLATPTSRDLGAVRLPRSLTWGYYLVRPVRLIGLGLGRAASRSMPRYWRSSSGRSNGRPARHPLSV